MAKKMIVRTGLEKSDPWWVTCWMYYDVLVCERCESRLSLCCIIHACRFTEVLCLIGDMLLVPRKQLFALRVSMLDYTHPPMVQLLNALYLIVPMHVAVLFKPHLYAWSGCCPTTSTTCTRCHCWLTQTCQKISSPAALNILSVYILPHTDKQTWTSIRFTSIIHAHMNTTGWTVCLRIPS